MSIRTFDEEEWQWEETEQEGRVVITALEEGTPVKTYGEWVDELENLKPKKQDLARSILDSWLDNARYYMQRELDLEQEVKRLKEQLEVIQIFTGTVAGVTDTFSLVQSGDTLYVRCDAKPAILEELKWLRNEAERLQEELDQERIGSSRIDKNCDKLRDTHSFEEYPENMPDAYQPALLLLDTGRYKTGHMNKLEQWINRRGDIIQETVDAWMHIPMRDRKEV